MSKFDALLTEKQMRDIFNYHKKYNKLEYTFYQFVDFCKKYSVRRCDRVTVHVPYMFNAKICDLQLHRMKKDGNYEKYSYEDFYWWGIPDEKEE